MRMLGLILPTPATSNMAVAPVDRSGMLSMMEQKPLTSLTRRNWYDFLIATHRNWAVCLAYEKIASNSARQQMILLL